MTIADWLALPEDTRRWCIEQALRMDAALGPTARHVADVLLGLDQVVQEADEPDEPQRGRPWRVDRGLA